MIEVNQSHDRIGVLDSLSVPRTNSLPLHLPMLPIVAAVLVPPVPIVVVVAGAMHSGRKPIQFAGESIALQPAGKNTSRKGKHGKKKEIKTNSAVNKLQRAKGKNNVEFVPHLSQ